MYVSYVVKLLTSVMCCHAAPNAQLGPRKAVSWLCGERRSGVVNELSAKPEASVRSLLRRCHAAKRPGRSVAFASARTKSTCAARRLGFCPRSAPSALAVRFSALLRCHAAKRPGRSVAFASDRTKSACAARRLGFCPRSAPSALVVRFSALLAYANRALNSPTMASASSWQISMI